MMGRLGTAWIAIGPKRLVEIWVLKGFSVKFGETGKLSKRFLDCQAGILEVVPFVGDAVQPGTTWSTGGTTLWSSKKTSD